MFFVAPSALVAGFGLKLAQMYPKYAREAKLNGLFARRGVDARATIGEYYGDATDEVGPYTMQFLDGRMVDPSARCVARYANFARSKKAANAEFVQRGERMFLVATRAIGAGEEVLTYKAHEAPVHPTRDARRAYEHVERAKEYLLTPETRGKALRHARRAKVRAREALRAIGEANDEALGFGARRTLLESKGGKAANKKKGDQAGRISQPETAGVKKAKRYECPLEVAYAIFSPKQGFTYKGKLRGKQVDESDESEFGGKSRTKQTAWHASFGGYDDDEIVGGFSMQLHRLKPNVVHDPVNSPIEYTGALDSDAREWDPATADATSHKYDPRSRYSRMLEEVRASGAFSERPVGSSSGEPDPEDASAVYAARAERAHAGYLARGKLKELTRDMYDRRMRGERADYARLQPPTRDRPDPNFVGYAIGGDTGERYDYADLVRGIERKAERDLERMRRG